MKSPDLPMPQEVPLKVGDWFNPFPDIELQEGDFARDDYVCLERQFAFLGLGSVSVEVSRDEGDRYHEGVIFQNNEPKLESEDGVNQYATAIGKRLMVLSVGVELDEEVLEELPSEDLPYKMEARMGEVGLPVYSDLSPADYGGDEAYDTIYDGWHFNGSGKSVKGRTLYIPYAEYILSDLQIRIVSKV